MYETLTMLLALQKEITELENTLVVGITGIGLHLKSEIFDKWFPGHTVEPFSDIYDKKEVEIDGTRVFALFPIAKGEENEQ